MRPAIPASSAQLYNDGGIDRRMDIQFYHVLYRRNVSVPLDQVKKAVFKQTTRNGKIRIHYILTAQLNGTILRKFVRREDWLALDVPQV